MNSGTALTGPQQIVIAANPRAGSGPAGALIDRLVASLSSVGLKVHLLHNLGQVISWAEAAHEAGDLRALVAAGGDGTVAEMVNRTAPGMPICVFPLGTANLLAGYLGIRADVDSFTQMLVQGHRVQFDAGRANNRIFLLMIGCGFDAEVVHRLHRNRRGHIRMWNYFKPIFDSIRSYEYPELRIRCDAAHPPAACDDSSACEPASGAAGDHLPGKKSNSNSNGPHNGDVHMTARFAFVANLPCYAAGLQFAPRALATDGQLDLCGFQQGSLWHGLRYLGYTWARRHHFLPDCQAAQARRIHIESDRPVPYQLDGDPGGMLPLDVEVLPGRLTLLVPAERSLQIASSEHEVTRV